jgi:hypothetical protein
MRAARTVRACAPLRLAAASPLRALVAAPPWRAPSSRSTQQPACMTTRAIEDARARHQRTLHAVFAHPTSASLRWRDLLSMLESFGAQHVTTSHEKERITLSGRTTFLHKPHGRNNHTTLASPAELVALRRFLTEVGLAPKDACAADVAAPCAAADVAPPASKPHGALHAPEKPSQRAPERVPPESLDGHHVLCLVAHGETRVYRTHAHGSPPLLLHPYDPAGVTRHLHHKTGVKHQSTPVVHGDYAPVMDARYAKSIMAALEPATEIILAGHGTGKSSAADALLAAMRLHAPALARRVVHRLQLSEGHVTENEVLAAVRRFYNARHDAAGQQQQA